MNNKMENFGIFAIKKKEDANKHDHDIVKGSSICWCSQATCIHGHSVFDDAIFGSAVMIS